MPAHVLRPYQQRAVTDTFARWREGARSVLMVLPTGGGKTSCFASIGSNLARLHGKRTVVLAHRRELVLQAAKRFREFGVDFGLIMRGELARPHALIQVASKDTLVRRDLPPADLVICDEAHLSTAKSWQTIIEGYPSARILGVTATPWRLSGKPLAGAYDACVVVAQPSELREAGFLCPYVGFSYKAPDLAKLKKTGGDYNEKASAERMSAGVIVDSIVEEYVAHARHLSAVVFAVTVEHSRQLCAKFKAAGVSAEHLDGETPQFERDAILRRVDEGRTMVLCNVGVAVEGLDIPRLKCCILARPTMSLARAIQMMGRVRRPWNGLTARIHDHAYVIKAHGLPDADRDYSLDAEPENPPSLSTCEVCRAVYVGARCPDCGKDAPVESLVAERKLKTVDDAEKIEFSSEIPEPQADGVEWPTEPEAPISVRWNRVGRELEGRYVRTYKLPTSWGESTVYVLEAPNGRTYEFPGTTDLDSRMARVNLSDYVWITYTEDKPLPGGKHKKLFRVEHDEAAT